MGWYVPKVAVYSSRYRYMQSAALIGAESVLSDRRAMTEWANENGQSLGKTVSKREN